MTDELLYAKLATSIADTGSPLPHVHGTSIAVYNQLYPLLLAPLYGALSPPEAFRAAHVLNAIVMASAVFPGVSARPPGALARRGRSRSAGLSVLVPWMVLTGFLMTESAAYPAFLWALLGLQLAIAASEPAARPARGRRPRSRRLREDAVRRARAGASARDPRARDRHAPRAGSSGMRNALARRIVVLAVALRRRLASRPIVAARGLVREPAGRLCGDGRGRSFLPSGVWSSAGRHLDAVAIGCGLVPLVLGGGWMLGDTRPIPSNGAHALATLSRGHDRAAHVRGSVVQRPLRRVGRPRPLPVLRRPPAPDRVGGGAHGRAGGRLRSGRRW